MMALISYGHSACAAKKNQTTQTNFFLSLSVYCYTVTMGRIHLHVLKLKLYLVTLFKKRIGRKFEMDITKLACTVQVEQKSSEIYDKAKFLYFLLHNVTP